MTDHAHRVPIRAAFAFAGAGSLGTFLAGAMCESVAAIKRHNEAVDDPTAAADDERFLNGSWGRVTIDAIGGSSAGALCGGQLVRALFDPDYLGEGKPIDAPDTATGDWIDYADFERLTVEGNTPGTSGPVEAPGWTIMSGAKLFEMSQQALKPSYDVDMSRALSESPIDPDGIVAIGITLTDLLGYHEYAEFECRSVLGHPEFGAVAPTEPTYHGYAGEVVRDLGILKHSEIRKLFVGCNHDAVMEVSRFLEATGRKGRARALSWKGAGDRLASLATASASLPIAIGPVAVTDQAAATDERIRRLYTDGGVMNNKPIAPALRLARWQDEVRLVRSLQSTKSAEKRIFAPDAVEQTLAYKRVCFFVDAFPERFRLTSRSPHPNEALLGSLSKWMTEEQLEARDNQISEALGSPTKGLAALFESMMTSLRAQDIRGIAEVNFRIRERDDFIARAIERGVSDSTFLLDSLPKAHAYSSVCLHEKGAKLSVPQRLMIAEQVWEANRMSGLTGRRRVTMIPVFSPENLVAVLAGEGLYALGGLLSRDARLHDAHVGRTVARSVMASLDPQKESVPVNLGDAPENVVPNDTKALVRRLKVTAEAAIHGGGTGSRFIRGLVAFPFKINPLVRLVKGRLDERVKGLPSTPDSDDESNQSSDDDVQ